MSSATAPRAVSRPRFYATLVAFSLVTIGAVHLLNSWVHESYVNFGGAVASLRVMTWNIGRIYLRWDSRASDRDLDYVAKVIREVNPQVVALQEMRDESQLKRLLSKLGSHWQGKLAEDVYDRHAALVKRVRGSYFDLPTSTGRTAQGAILELPGGRRLAVISAHLDAFDAQRRVAQAQEIVLGAQQLSTHELVLAGDLNFDVALVARDSPDQRLYTFMTHRLVDAAAHAGGTTLTAKRLDYVFYASRRLRVLKANVLRQQVVHAMDHYPLVVELAL